MAQKSYMNWQTAFCLAAFITLIFVLPVFSPLYLKMMGGEMFGFVDSVPKYVSLLYSTGSFFLLTFLLFVFDFQLLKGRYAELVFYGRSAPDNAAIQLFTVAVI